jgi:hypothetical protein
VPFGEVLRPVPENTPHVQQLYAPRSEVARLVPHGAAMNTQLAGLPMFDTPEPERRRLEREATIDARFKLFHLDNQHIYRELHRRALALVDRGVEHFGIALLWESMRYDAAIRSEGNAYKLNNDFRSRYARMLLAREPRLVGRLETRELRSA